MIGYTDKTLSVEANEANGKEIFYQWYVFANPVPGGTSSTLEIPDDLMLTSGTYEFYCKMRLKGDIPTVTDRIYVNYYDLPSRQLHTLTVGEEYSTDHDYFVTSDIVAGSLPDGFNISDEGMLTGKTMVAGDYYYALNISRSFDEQTKSVVLLITVEEPEIDEIQEEPVATPTTPTTPDPKPTPKPADQAKQQTQIRLRQ